MTVTCTSRGLLLAALLAAAPCIPSASAAGADAGADVRPVASTPLPNVQGSSITAVVVNYAPGGRSGQHHHAGSACSLCAVGHAPVPEQRHRPGQVYKAGESFFAARQ